MIEVPCLILLDYRITYVNTVITLIIVIINDLIEMQFALMKYDS